MVNMRSFTLYKNAISSVRRKRVSPSESIYFFLIAICMLIIILFVWLIFRKRKKWAVGLTSLLVIGYIAYFLYYPTLKVNSHSERYEQVIAYLAKNYPNKEFHIEPKHYEEGYNVGEFTVNDVKLPTMGVTLRVGDEGEVTQLSAWSKNEYPTQQELWREIEFFYGETYSLDKEIAKIIKQDEWIDGELTVFALTIDDMPTIAIFNYSSEGYKLLELQQGEQEGFIFIEIDDYVWIYIDESYQGEKVTMHLKNGEEYALHVDENKGKLIVEKMNND